MATAAYPESALVGPHLDLQSHNPFSMFKVKQEVVDPSYIDPSNSTPPAYSDPTNNHYMGAMPPSLSTHANTGTATPPIEKVKRKYTQKAKPRVPAAKLPVPAAQPPQVKQEPTAGTDPNEQSQITDHMSVRKKRDRFKGTTEEEVLTRVLPDHVRPDLDILIVGINPGLTAAYCQHHYAGPGNHFWKCLYLSGMIPEPMKAVQDAELMNYGIGFTNIVARTTRGSADLTRKEIFEGGEILKVKMLKFLPKIALFNGKGIYEVFCGHKKFAFGLQPEPFPGCPNTVVFVNPSSSARCTQLPRAQDKVPFYEALKRVRDHIREHGSIEGIDRSTVTFPDFKLVTAPQKNKVKTEPVEGAEPTHLPPNQPTNDTSAGEPKAKKPRKPAAPRKPRTSKPKQQVQSKPTTSANIPTTNHSQPPNGVIVNNNTNHHNIDSSQPNVPSSMMQTQYSNANNMASATSLANSMPMMPVSAAALSNMNQYYSQQVMVNMSSTQPVGQIPPDFLIKKEVTEETAAQDRDLAHILSQAWHGQQSLLHQQFAKAMMPGQYRNPIPAVKQERPDWQSYGLNPAMSAAAAMPNYWNYLQPNFQANTSNSMPMYNNQPTTSGPMPTAPTPNIATPTPRYAPVTTLPSTTAATPAYKSPQEASSPAMSTLSNLTQASLDSLPKADSASTVANWLQSVAASLPE